MSDDISNLTVILIVICLILFLVIVQLVGLHIT